MTQYINKDAIVAEIESYISNYKDILARTDRSDEVWVDFVSMVEAKIDVLQHLLIFLDTLEVKEVDFVKEFYTFSEKHKLMDKGIEFSDIEKTASFFFQLGIKAAQNEHKSCTTDE